MKYSKKLENAIKTKKSNLVIGLDTDIRKIPKIFLRNRNPILEFNKSVVSATSEVSAGYKLNLAFYEVLGKYCFSTLEHTLHFIQQDMIKICDGKRGDIGNTDEYYAEAYFDNLNFDSITISPYMGSDSVEPFLKWKEKGVYVLALTSNKGFSDFQMLKSGKKYLYETVMEKCIGWDKNKQIGFVVGANHTNVIKKITTEYPYISLLIPGIGAQGNDLDMLLKSLKNNKFIINASRSIIYDTDDFKTFKEFEKKVKLKALELNSKINSR